MRSTGTTPSLPWITKKDDASNKASIRRMSHRSTILLMEDSFIPARTAAAVFGSTSKRMPVVFRRLKFQRSRRLRMLLIANVTVAPVRCEESVYR